jgi:hypothetical protein
MNDTSINVRCNLEELDKFKEWCRQASKPYQDIIREAMQAGPDGRLHITPSKGQKQALNNLYK